MFLLYLCFKVFLPKIEDGFGSLVPVPSLLALVHSLWTVESVTLVEHQYLEFTDLWPMPILVFLEDQSCFRFSIVSSSLMFSLLLSMWIPPMVLFSRIRRSFGLVFPSFIFNSEFFLYFFVRERERGICFFFFLVVLWGSNDTEQPSLVQEDYVFMQTCLHWSVLEIEIELLLSFIKTVSFSSFNYLHLGSPGLTRIEPSDIRHILENIAVTNHDWLLNLT